MGYLHSLFSKETAVAFFNIIAQYSLKNNIFLRKDDFYVFQTGHTFVLDV